MALSVDSATCSSSQLQNLVCKLAVCIVAFCGLPTISSHPTAQLPTHTHSALSHTRAFSTQANTQAHNVFVKDSNTNLCTHSLTHAHPLTHSRSPTHSLTHSLRQPHPLTQAHLTESLNHPHMHSPLSQIFHTHTQHQLKYLHPHSCNHTHPCNHTLNHTQSVSTQSLTQSVTHMHPNSLSHALNGDPSIGCRNIIVIWTRCTRYPQNLL